MALRCTEWPMTKEINANWTWSTACGRSFDNYCLICLCPCKSCVWNDIVRHGANMYKGSPSKDAVPRQRQQFFPFWFIKKSHRLIAYIPSVIITIEDWRYSHTPQYSSYTLGAYCSQSSLSQHPLAPSIQQVQTWDIRSLYFIFSTSTYYPLNSIPNGAQTYCDSGEHRLRLVWPSLLDPGSLASKLSQYM